MVAWDKLTIKELAHQIQLTDDVDIILLIEMLIISKNYQKYMRDFNLSLENQIAKIENNQLLGKKNARINGNTTGIKGPKRTKK